MQRAFFLLIWPVLRFLLGADAIHKENLPAQGPAIVVANHNSHMDTLLLLSLFPRQVLRHVRPVAASDYFLAGAIRRWFALSVLNVIAIDRKGGSRDPLEGIRAALQAGEIVLLFPEGTRGEPEVSGPFKSGVARLAADRPEVPVVPVFIQGAGRSLPRGSFLPVPFTCTVVCGAPVAWTGDRGSFMAALADAFAALRQEAPPLHWS